MLPHRGTILRVWDRKVLDLGAIRFHEEDHVVSAAYINTDVKWVHREITSFRSIFAVNRIGKAHDTGASTPSRIRIQPEKD